jgi:integrase/recombinase XerD
MNELPSFASALAPVIVSYLALKRALGRQYNAECAVLRQVDRFLAARAADLTRDTFTDWCVTLQHLTADTRREYLRIVRNLCAYRRRSQPAAFVPERPPCRWQRQKFRPHLFTDVEVARLLATADALAPTPTSPLRRETFRLAIVILYTAGLRCGELVRLTVGDYDPAAHTLLIRDSKFYKSRVVPLSADGAREVEHSLAVRRSRRLPASPESPLLWHRSRGGLAWSGDAFSHRMHALFRRAGIRTAAGKLPRVHDFRHGFAVEALLRWYRAGADVQAKLPFLATYMGHASIVSTEYYLQLIGPLAALASERFARHCGAVVTASVPLGGAS